MGIAAKSHARVSAPSLLFYQNQKIKLIIPMMDKNHMTTKDTEASHYCTLLSGPVTSLKNADSFHDNSSMLLIHVHVNDKKIASVNTTQLVQQLHVHVLHYH